MKKKMVSALLTMILSSMMVIHSFAATTCIGWMSIPYWEVFYHEDGSLMQNEWYSYETVNGATYQVYVGADGKVLLNTTTPDGYKVNHKGCWYTYNEWMPMAEVNYDTARKNGLYPLSFDGNVAKNEDLGITFTFTEEDFKNMPGARFPNCSATGGFEIFSVLNKECMIGVQYYPYHKTAEEEKAYLEEENAGQRLYGNTEKTYVETTLCGKYMIGERFEDKEYGDSTFLYSQLASGEDLFISVSTYPWSTITLDELLQWINEHMTVSK